MDVDGPRLKSTRRRAHLNRDLVSTVALRSISARRAGRDRKRGVGYRTNNRLNEEAANGCSKHHKGHMSSCQAQLEQVGRYKCHFSAPNKLSAEYGQISQGKLDRGRPDDTLVAGWHRHGVGGVHECTMVCI